MVQVHFFIRFRGQLRRTRPELIATLENTVTEAAAATGGSVEGERKFLSASFDEDRIGFWLDVVIFLERVHLVLEKAAPELYGFALVLGRDIQDTSVHDICRSLSLEYSPGSSGIWCSREVCAALEHYLLFVPTSSGFLGSTDDDPLHKRNRMPLPEGYRELKDFLTFGDDRQVFPYREKIKQTLEQGDDKNALLLGPEFLGKKDGVFHYCKSVMGDVPPLVVSFGTGYPRQKNSSGRHSSKTPAWFSRPGGRGLVCFADAYTPQIRSFIAAFGAARGSGKTAEVPTGFRQNPELKSAPSVLDELDAAHDLLFRERLRNEWSLYMLQKTRQFITSLLIAYNDAAKTKTDRGILILEDLGLADSGASEIFMEVYSSLEEKPLILATDSSSEEALNIWSEVIPRILKFSADDFLVKEKIDLPRDHSRDLWELSYNIYLLGRYFPSYLFPELFEEEGLSRDMYFRAVEMLASLGVVVPEDPRPRIFNFALRAEKVLGERKDKIRSVVRSRILAWVLSGRLRPCFNLLRLLSELGEGASDVLVLRSLNADVHNGTYGEIEYALSEGQFTSLVGVGNTAVLNYIYKTLKALVWGEKNDIKQFFNKPVPQTQYEDGTFCYAGYQAQVQTNLAAFYIGSRSAEAASDAVRKAMVLNKELGENAVPVYRLFSLVNLSKQRIDDALEYISFAVEQAERTDLGEELFLTCYYASSINFIHGNLSKAERLALRAEEVASELGQLEWGMRAKFFRGRLCFETGRYRDALDIFESLEPSVPVNNSESAEGRQAADGIAEEPPLRDFRQTMAGTVRAWIFRARNFLGRFSPFGDDDFSAGSDGAIFAIEAAYLVNDFERAVDLANRFLSLPEGDAKIDFLYTEQPDWGSGFNQCEYMFRPGKTLGTRLAWVYRAMAQCALKPTQEAKTEILEGMQRLIRDELLPDTDPTDAFYFYAWYCMLRDIRAAQVDINTIISMAYKRLQRRAGRIDDTGVRQVFLNLSRWNSTLCTAAREYKLI